MRIKYYASLLQGMKELLTPQAVVYFIILFSEYITCMYSEEYLKDKSKVITGAFTVRDNTESVTLFNIVKLRNAIVHCTPKLINSSIDTLINVDLNEEKFHTVDNLTVEGVLAIKKADLQALKNFLLQSFSLE